MKRFDKSQYTLGSDGLYRRLLHFGGKSEIMVRDDRGDLVRIERVKADAAGNAQCKTVAKAA